MATIGQKKAQKSKTGTYTNSRGKTYTASGGSSGGSSNNSGVLTGSAETAVRNQIASIQSGINQLASSQGKTIRKTSSGGYEAVPINSTNLNSPELDIPTPKINTTPNANVDANNLGLVGGLADYGVTMGQNNQLEISNEKPEGQTNQQNLDANRIKSLIGLEDYLPNAEKIARESGQREVEQARREVQNYTGQINTITANRDAQQLALEGQGRGQTSSFLGGQQAQIAREAAIQALPVQGLLASAQGNLELAQQHFETTFKMKMEDARSRYEYKSNLIKSVFDIADKNEQRILDAQEKQADRNFSLYSSDINRFSSMIPSLIENGDAKTAAKLAQLPKLDVSSPTFAQDYQSFQQQASSILAGAKSAITGGGSGGVGATGGLVTATGKPMNDTQATSYGYAQRLVEANSIISSIGANFTGAKSYVGQILPNILKTEDRQSFEQAQRNFINAVLRKESGAVISTEEFNNAKKQYFPQPGDTEKVLTQKEANRQTVIDNFYRQSGSSQSQTETITRPEDLRSKYNY